MGAAATKVVLEGELDEVALPELVQMLCMAGNTREIDLSIGERQVGRLTISGGHVVRCVAFGLVGVDAFLNLLQQRAGRYVVRIVPEPSDHALHTNLARISWQALLIEAARRHDSASGKQDAMPEPAADASDAFDLRLSSIPPTKEVSEIRRVVAAASAAVITPDPPQASPPSRPNAYVGLLQERATEAYLRRDLREALRLFECSLALAPGDARTIANVARIKTRLGI